VTHGTASHAKPTAIPSERYVYRITLRYLFEIRLRLDRRICGKFGCRPSDDRSALYRVAISVPSPTTCNWLIIVITGQSAIAYRRVRRNHLHFSSNDAVSDTKACLHSFIIPAPVGCFDAARTEDEPPISPPPPPQLLQQIACTIFCPPTRRKKPNFRRPNLSPFAAARLLMLS